jgi:MYXO-CTERM domain-containing protein
MTQQRTPHRRAAALLITAAALPFTPLAAQESQPEADTPPAFKVEVPAPIATQPIEIPAPEPEVTAPPVAATTAPAAEAPAARSAPARAAARTAPRPAARAPARAAPAPAAAPAPTAAAEAPAPAQAAPAPVAEAVPPPVQLPAAPAAVPPAQPEQGGGSNLIWIVLGALALGAAALFLLLRRRRSGEVEERQAAVYEEPVHEPAGAPVADTDWQPAAAGAVPAATAAAAPVEAGRPELDLELRPRRAGVTGDEAVVEFELDVANHGSAAARDVRVSTWMIPAGSGSEMERALIDPSSEAELHDIGAGSGERIARSVSLPTDRVEGDAVLPLVVAEARYTLPDGSEGRTSATYAVGVPDGEELAHFAIDNPSGLHDEVVARPLGEPERV